MSFSTFQYPHDVVPAGTTSFTISPEAPTDIWRKPGPPEVTTFNAPIIYRKLALKNFKSARVTVSANWGSLYDQGGLFFGLPVDGDGQKGKWIKTGIEFYDGAPYVSTVCKDQWADWSLVKAGGTKVELLAERHEVEGTLWIYVLEGGKKIPLRECTWILSEDGESEFWVGVYACRPTKGPELEVKFEGWVLETLA